MKMKYLNFLFIFSLSFGQTDDEFIRDYYKYDLNEYELLEIDLNFALGELKISTNDKPKTISGIIEYDPERTETDVVFSTLGEKAILTINGETGHDFQCCDDGINFKDFNLGDNFYNSMDFKLAKGIPTELQLGFGLGEANIDLTDLSLSYFELDCGLSDVKLEMESSNKITCERVSISSGLGDFNGYGLGNLNTRKFILDVGLGSATIDLRGKFDEDMDLSIDVGLGSLELILPKDVNIKLRVDHSFLSSVDVDGLMSKGRNKYVSKDWDENRPTIIGDISVGIGAVDVEVD
jgi:hypothetical protein